MSKEICISSTPHETRLAILEDELLTEVYYERENEYTLAGSIYKGRVTRVLPGMQSAFVDLGLERDAFLYVTDFMEEQEDSSEFERMPSEGRSDEREPAAREPQARQRAPQAANRASGPRASESRVSESRVSEPRASEPRASEDEPKQTPVSTSAEGADSPGGEFEDGTRRWRGRRGRRKGSRPAQGGQQGGQQAGQQGSQQPAGSARVEAPAPAPALSPLEAEVQEKRAPVFSLPGESLSKYGSAPKIAPVESSSRQARPSVSGSKPSTLIDTPLEWNGDGLLPGESISRYRGDKEAQPAEPAAIHPEPEQIYTAPEEGRAEEPAPHAAPVEEEAPEVGSGYEVAEPEEPHTRAEPHTPAEPEIHAQPDTQEQIHTTATDHVPEAPEFEPEEGSASHRIDRSAPSEFRFARPIVFCCRGRGRAGPAARNACG